MRDGTVNEVITNVSAFGFPTGLVGTIGVRVDLDGANVIARTTVGIDEFPADSGVYVLQQLALPGSAGFYQIVWDNGAFPLTPEDVAVEDLAVYASSVPTPLPPPDPGEGPVAGPCTAWATIDDLLDCCSAEIGSDTAFAETMIDEATQLLFELSGRQFTGLCTRAVRPCATGGCFSEEDVLWPASGWGYGVGWGLGYGWGAWGGAWGWGGAVGCSCSHVSEVTLPGYPVAEVTQVQIDGVVVDPSTYRLDRRNLLVRVTPTSTELPLRWPSCQNLSLPPDQPGTWIVHFTSGQSPPLAATSAVTQLACELYKACTAGSANCALPGQVTRITRQGITIERAPFTAWGRSRTTGNWMTGMSMVDAFLSVYNGKGLRRRPTVWSPDVPGMGRPVG